MASRQTLPTDEQTQGAHTHGLPHERDESPTDEASPDNPRNDRIGQQAHDDQRRGIQDTTIAPQIDQAYRRVRSDADRDD